METQILKDRGINSIVTFYSKKETMKSSIKKNAKFTELSRKVKCIYIAFILSTIVSHSSFSQQCIVTGNTNATPINLGCGTTYTVTGSVMLQTYINGGYFPCGGSVLVEMQKYDSFTTNWNTLASMVTTNSFYGLGLDQNWGPGSYRIYASNTSNNCNCYYNTTPYISQTIISNIDAPPIFSVGQKIDATTSNLIPNNTTCTSPYSNICPGTYGYILTAANTNVPSNQIINGQWSCSLEEVPYVKGCVATPTLVFTKPYTIISSMSNLGNIDLNSYATTYGSKPANYIKNSNKKWKFTLNIKYSCNNIYTYTCWLYYNNTGCRIANSGFSDEAQGILSENLLTLFPNPTNSDVEIKTNETIKSISIFDINGKETKTEITNNKIDLRYLAAGIYTLKIYTNNGISTKKIIKQD